MSAVASLGMILLWDVETSFNVIDKFSHSNQNYVKAGVILGIGWCTFLCFILAEFVANPVLLAQMQVWSVLV